VRRRRVVGDETAREGQRAAASSPTEAAPVWDGMFLSVLVHRRRGSRQPFLRPHLGRCAVHTARPSPPTAEAGTCMFCNAVPLLTL